MALVIVIASAFAVNAQTKTTEDLAETSSGLSLFFYKNTLRMLNQSEDKDFDELIKDIEKMRFLMIDKAKQKFEVADFKKLVSGYQGEDYEEIMSSRYQGRNFNVYIKEKGGNVKGTVILASDSASLIVLDILGKVALDKATTLFKTIDESSDIGGKVKNFMNGDSKKKNKKKAEVQID